MMSDDSTVKTCSICLEIKPVIEFGKDLTVKTLLKSAYNECAAKRSSVYRKRKINTKRGFVVEIYASQKGSSKKKRARLTRL